MEVRLDGRVLEQLTAREFELLRELLSSPGRVFTREILLAKLWGYDFSGTSGWWTATSRTSAKAGGGLH